MDIFLGVRETSQDEIPSSQAVTVQIFRNF